ncbi:MAG: 3-deoxy-8-phosphooctulonate synthase [Phycisphaerales bacterium]|nr:3-deoxy-8-phosphooctulonate synthase [Phycisphaerales bacterium]
MSFQIAKIGEIGIGDGHPLAFIAGPCVIESRDHTMRMADELSRVCRRLDVPLVFKASFDKANRSSADSFRGVAIDKACEIFAEIGREMGIPVTTDIHLPEQAMPIGSVVDCLQIPAFLCRQTDLLVAAAVTNRCVNIKKGQFMSPEEMGNACKKVVSMGNRNILLTERGTFFGYHRLVNDMTALRRMRQFAPVVFDSTHSCQQPGGEGTCTGGVREYVQILGPAAVAAGADAVFLEVHDNPAEAMSDAATQLPLDQFEHFITKCIRVRDAVAGE